MYLPYENKCLIVKQNLVDILSTFFIEHITIGLPISIPKDFYPSNFII